MLTPSMVWISPLMRKWEYEMFITKKHSWYYQFQALLKFCSEKYMRKFVFPRLVSLHYVVHRNMFNILFIYQMEISLSDYVGKENAFSASLDSECAPDLVFLWSKCTRSHSLLCFWQNITYIWTILSGEIDQALKTVKVFQT